MRLIGLAGWSGAGKTTLLTHLIPYLKAQGVSVSTIKHAHHSFDMDRPGKDSHTHRLAGAQEVLVSSSRRFALIHELREAPEPRLAELLVRLLPVDLVIVEGFKGAHHPKIEVFRATNGKPPLHVGDPKICAIATDTPFAACALPQFALEDYAGIAAIMAQRAMKLADFVQADALAHSLARQDPAPNNTQGLASNHAQDYAQDYAQDPAQVPGEAESDKEN